MGKRTPVPSQTVKTVKASMNKNSHRKRVILSPRDFKLPDDPAPTRDVTHCQRQKNSGYSSTGTVARWLAVRLAGSDKTL
jgi:hypothetical protein